MARGRASDGAPRRRHAADPGDAADARPSRPRRRRPRCRWGRRSSNSEKEGLKLAVQRCWNVPAGVRDAQELKVTLAAELAADGAVINASIRMIEPRNAARRPLPAGLRGRAAGADPLLALRPAAREVRAVAQHRSRLQPRGNGVMVEPAPPQPPHRRARGPGAAALRRRGAGAAPDRDHRGGDRADALRRAGLRAGQRRGGGSRGADHPGGDRRPDRHRPLPRDPERGAHRADLELRRAGRLRRLEGDQRAGADHRGGGDERRPGAGALPALGRLRPAGARRGAAVRGRRGRLAAAGAQGGGRGLCAADRRERLFRQQGRLHRRLRAEGRAAQAARDHGLRRRERGDADRRQPRWC